MILYTDVLILLLKLLLILSDPVFRSLLSFLKIEVFPKIDVIIMSLCIEDDDH